MMDRSQLNNIVFETDSRRCGPEHLSRRVITRRTDETERRLRLPKKVPAVRLRAETARKTYTRIQTVIIFGTLSYRGTTEI